MADGDLANVGTHFRDTRVRLRLTQADVARRLTAGVTLEKGQTWVSAVERGSAELTPTETVLLALALRVDPIEALEVAGFLQTPTWERRLEGKLDRLAAAVAELKEPG
jgi:transcriptional regulator with XRE-family HTH domain